MSAGYCSICSYFSHMKSSVQLYLFFSNSEEFGKPIDFNETNSKYNRYSFYYYCYLASLIMIILFGSEMFKTKQCQLENLQFNIHEVCGLFTYTWMPFNIDFFPVKQIYLFSQLFGAHYIYMMIGLTAWMVLESIEHIATRIRHVGYLFDESLKEPDKKIRRQKFNMAVRYHNAVLE